MSAGHNDTFHHARDFPQFEFPFGYEYKLPKIELPGGFELQLTKFMVLQVVAGLLLLWIGVGLARRVRSGRPVRGPWWNFWEFLALYVRDKIVRPTIGTGGHHDHGGDQHDSQLGAVHEHEHGHAQAEYAHPADRFLPFVWSISGYVLICNLLGIVPFLGSATGEINVTGALAVCTTIMVVISGMQASGVVGFWRSLAPKMDLSPGLKLGLVPMIWLIELVGFGIKHCVLAVRLFANMLGGHTVLGVILAFIATTADSWVYYLVLPSSIFGQVAISMLELLVAFIQAYVFAFLASLFISMAVHPH